MKRDTRALMLGGTASHVGKSVLAAGLCRILRQDGIRVAPFKAQNMSLNSYVCLDGAEIGRAQVAQAQAAGVEPEADMNPILLKPTSDQRMQIVLHGRVHSTTTAIEYYANKEFFFGEALRSYRRLAERFDVIVIEGAGSVAEMNLMDRDIVNLPFAAAVDAPVVLIADIDRGGVFASIVGTLELLPPAERERIRGFIINRFRGNRSLFDSGVQFLEERTRRRCFGVMPYIESLRVDQEDSVSLEDRGSSPSAFRIAVVRLPRISNYTDFNPLECIDGVSVEYVEEPRGRYDLVILPGTKNTIRDLRWLVERGFPQWLDGAFVLGICGGYQMLGTSISDPHNVEESGAMSGLGLLPVETEMDREKVTVRSHGESFVGPRIEGYEIHMGRTKALTGDVEPFCTKPDGTTDGCVRGRVSGTYFHGVFENSEFTKRFLGRIAEERGLKWRPENVSYSRDGEYERLARLMREHLAMDRLYGLLGFSHPGGVAGASAGG